MDGSTDKLLGNLLKIISLSSVAFYVAGFFIWNIFLFGLKFNEIEILQSRFIYTGFFFFIYFYIFILIIYLIFKYILPIHFELSLLEINAKNRIRISLTTAFCVLIIFSYSFYIFPRIPRIFGGGRPLALSILPNKTNLTLKDLQALGIPSGEGSDIQTANLCVAYENSSIILVLLENRVVQFNKSQLNGIAALPEKRTNKYERDVCGSWAIFWINSGL